MKKIINWAAGLLKDEKGSPSSKRFIGVIAGLSLCITLFANQFTEEHIAPSPILINAVAALAFGALGLASVDKIWSKRDKE
jgi:xanthine/uracil permease